LYFVKQRDSFAFYIFQTGRGAQTRIQWVPRVKLPEREADNSPTSSA